MVTTLDLVVQKYKSGIRLFEPYPSKSAIYVHEHCAVAELILGPAPEEAYGESSFAATRSRDSYAYDRVDSENVVVRQSSSTQSAYKVAP